MTKDLNNIIQTIKNKPETEEERYTKLLKDFLQLSTNDQIDFFKAIEESCDCEKTKENSRKVLEERQLDKLGPWMFKLVVKTISITVAGSIMLFIWMDLWRNEGKGLGGIWEVFKIVLGIG